MEKENELITEDKKAIFFNDTFHINTEKPVPLSQKLKKKLLKWSKPFGLGVGVYFLYELLKNIGSTLVDWGQASYQFFVDIIDKINVFLLTTPTPVAPPPVSSDSSNPATIGEMTNNIAGSMSGMVDLISGMAYIVAIGLGMNAALKLKEHNENPDRVAISQPITMMMISAMMMALPSFLGTAATTTFSTGAANVDHGSNTVTVVTPDKNVPTLVEAK